MAIKCLRLEIIKPYNPPEAEQIVSWNELGNIFRDLRYISSKMANFVIQKCYEWEVFRQKYKEENGVYPVPKEHKDKSYLYPMVRERFPEVATHISNQVRQQAEKIWKSCRIDILSLRKSIPSFKMNFPICIYNEGYSIGKTENSYIVSAGLQPRGSERTRYEFIIKAGEKSKKDILDRLITGKYKKGALQIVSDSKNKWYCLIPYEFSQDSTKQLDHNKIMGVDVGIVNAVYWAFSDTLQRGKIEGGEIETFRKRVQERRRAIQRQGKYCGEGRIGHGRGRRLKPISVLEERESDFRDTTNHRYAKKIVQEAFNHSCGIIQIEDLTGINEKSTFLKNWSYFDLQNKISYKAEELGIKVVKINPEYTSQRCSQCGYIHRDNRQDQATFICQNCGFGALFHCFGCGNRQKEGGYCINCGNPVKQQLVHADYNAAKNIATADIENKIQVTLRQQV